MENLTIEQLYNQLHETIKCIVKKDGLLLKDFRNVKLQTPEICAEAIKSNGSALPYICDEYRNYEICLDVIKQYPEMIQYVPEKYRTVDLMNLALEKDPLNHKITKYIYDKTFVANYLINNNLCKIVEDDIDKCVSCNLIQKYYFEYWCDYKKVDDEIHFTCIECNDDICDEMYNVNRPIYDTIYLNTNYKEK